MVTNLCELSLAGEAQQQGGHGAAQRGGQVAPRAGPRRGCSRAGAGRGGAGGKRVVRRVGESVNRP